MDRVRAVFDRPQVVYRVVVPLLVVFWFLSSVGQGDRNDGTSGGSPIGTVGWVLFFLTFVATVLFTVVGLGRWLVRRRQITS